MEPIPPVIISISFGDACRLNAEILAEILINNPKDGLARRIYDAVVDGMDKQSRRWREQMEEV